MRLLKVDEEAKASFLALTKVRDGYNESAVMNYIDETNKLLKRARSKVVLLARNTGAEESQLCRCKSRPLQNDSSKPS